MIDYKSIEIAVEGNKETGMLNHPFRLGEQIVAQFGVYKENGLTVWVVNTGRGKVAEIEPLDWAGKMFPYPEECQKLVEAMCDLWRKQKEVIATVNKLTKEG